MLHNTSVYLNCPVSSQRPVVVSVHLLTDMWRHAFCKHTRLLFSHCANAFSSHAIDRFCWTFDLGRIRLPTTFGQEQNRRKSIQKFLFHPVHTSLLNVPDGSFSNLYKVMLQYIWKKLPSSASVARATSTFCFVDASCLTRKKPTILISSSVVCNIGVVCGNDDLLTTAWTEVTHF